MEISNAIRQIVGFQPIVSYINDNGNGVNEYFLFSEKGVVAEVSLLASFKDAVDSTGADNRITYHYDDGFVVTVEWI
jgi:hypothetical protein